MDIDRPMPNVNNEDDQRGGTITRDRVRRATTSWPPCGSTPGWGSWPKNTGKSPSAYRACR
jgi:hypothetical protein